MEFNRESYLNRIVKRVSRNAKLRTSLKILLEKETCLAKEEGEKEVYVYCDECPFYASIKLESTCILFYPKSHPWRKNYSYSFLSQRDLIDKEAKDFIKKILFLSLVSLGKKSKRKKIL